MAANPIKALKRWVKMTNFWYKPGMKPVIDITAPGNEFMEELVHAILDCNTKVIVLVDHDNEVLHIDALRINPKLSGVLLVEFMSTASTHVRDAGYHGFQVDVTRTIREAVDSEIMYWAIDLAQSGVLVNRVVYILSRDAGFKSLVDLLHNFGFAAQLLDESSAFRHLKKAFPGYFTRF